MPLISVVVVLIVIGVLLGLLNKFGAEWMAVPYLKLVNAVAIIGTVLWLLFLLLAEVGLWDGNLSNMRVGR